MRQQLAVDVHTHYFWVFSEEAREFRQKVGLGTIDGMRDSAGNVIGNAGGYQSSFTGTLSISRDRSRPIGPQKSSVACSVFRR